MRNAVAMQLEVLRLEVKEVHNVKNTLLQSQETQTEMELVMGQEAAVSVITTPTQPLQHPQECTLPQELHKLIQTTAKPNTEYNINEYILTVQECTCGKIVFSVQQKSNATRS